MTLDSAIERIETVAVDGGSRTWIFVRVVCVDGLVGVGEASLEWRNASVAAAVGELEPMLIGADSHRIEHLWQLMYRARRHRGGLIELSAISGVEQALWDLKGKRAGLPVYELLGGACRDRLEVYANAPHHETTEGMVAAARGIVDLGFHALKLGGLGIGASPVEDPAVVARWADTIAAVCDAVGPSIRVAVDAAARLTPTTAILLARRLEPLGIWFLEEPVRAENVEALVEVARRTSIPIAAGEQLLTRWGFEPLLRAGAIALIQPDIAHCGGIAEGRRIAAMAELQYAGFAPHNPLGPVNTMASAHLAMTVPNFVALEYKADAHVPWLAGADVPWREEITIPAVAQADGWLQVSRSPGLGIELDLDACAAHPPRAIAFQTDDHVRADGSFSDC